MGLDMYLYRKYKNENYMDDVAYWRKANAIHRWFEAHITKDGKMENCGEYLVTKEDLEQLRACCQYVLLNSNLVEKKVCVGDQLIDGELKPRYELEKVIEDPTVAQNMLPTKSGFFFGGTDYDEWYISKLESTIEQIDRILEDTDFEHEELYYSAWW